MRNTLFLTMIALLPFSSAVADRLNNEPIKPIEPFVSTEPDKVELGKKLFLIPGCPAQALSPVIPAITSVQVAVTICQPRLAIIGSKALSTPQPSSIQV